MEFTWRMATVVAWPTVALFVLVIYRRSITSSLATAIEGARLKRLKAGPGGIEVELDTNIGAAGREVALALASLPRPAVADGQVPTSLVDFIGQVSRDPRGGMRTAFGLVQRALAESYPQLRSSDPDHLMEDVRRLARRGELSREVELAVGQLFELFEMSESHAAVDQARGYDFLMLAEGAIHVILRSAQAGIPGSEEGPARFPIESRWYGQYNDDYPIRLHVMRWDGDEFSGEMTYPGSGTVTRVAGHVKAGARDSEPVPVTWEEMTYADEGSRRIDFNGRYEANVSGHTMKGTWRYQNSPRVVADFTMEARSS